MEKESPTEYDAPSKLEAYRGKAQYLFEFLRHIAYQTQKIGDAGAVDYLNNLKSTIDYCQSIKEMQGHIQEIQQTVNGIMMNTPPVDDATHSGDDRKFSAAERTINDMNRQWIDPHN